MSLLLSKTKPCMTSDDYISWCSIKCITPIFFVGLILYMYGVQIDCRGGTALSVRYTLCNFSSSCRSKDAAWAECTALEEQSSQPSMAVLKEMLDDVDKLHVDNVSHPMRGSPPRRQIAVPRSGKKSGHGKKKSSGSSKKRRSSSRKSTRESTDSKRPSSSRPIEIPIGPLVHYLLLSVMPPVLQLGSPDLWQRMADITSGSSQMPESRSVSALAKRMGRVRNSIVEGMSAANHEYCMELLTWLTYHCLDIRGLKNFLDPCIWALFVFSLPNVVTHLQRCPDIFDETVCVLYNASILDPDQRITRSELELAAILPFAKEVARVMIRDNCQFSFFHVHIEIVDNVRSCVGGNKDIQEAFLQGQQSTVPDTSELTTLVLEKLLEEFILLQKGMKNSGRVVLGYLALITANTPQMTKILGLHPYLDRYQICQARGTQLFVCNEDVPHRDSASYHTYILSSPSFFFSSQFHLPHDLMHLEVLRLGGYMTQFLSFCLSCGIVIKLPVLNICSIQNIYGIDSDRVELQRGLKIGDPTIIGYLSLITAYSPERSRILRISHVVHRCQICSATGIQLFQNFGISHRPLSDFSSPLIHPKRSQIHVKETQPTKHASMSIWMGVGSQRPFSASSLAENFRECRIRDITPMVFVRVILFVDGVATALGGNTALSMKLSLEDKNASTLAAEIILIESRKLQRGFKIPTVEGPAFIFGSLQAVVADHPQRCDFTQVVNAIAVFGATLRNLKCSLGSKGHQEVTSRLVFFSPQKKSDDFVPRHLFLSDPLHMFQLGIISSITTLVKTITSPEGQGGRQPPESTRGSSVSRKYKDLFAPQTQRVDGSDIPSKYWMILKDAKDGSALDPFTFGGLIC
ncbi:hypothetical protein ADUPG1_010627 [Aduncisulcus paluster]|uniref:Uncharacterized protein n=1 Tax=Aduncisulcus paluster TaxID=2918883 RepID=A0ABQ5JS80_9EUKA|nr:hypothetical protein ADUPG1_010627 [Aduncisulcus paluster]